MQRRDLFKAAPAFGFAGLIAAGAAPAVAAQETPVMAMFREWQPLSAWLNGSEGQAASEAEFNQVNDQRIDLENRMMAEPEQGPADVLAKMLAWTHYGEDDLMARAHLPQVWAEARAILEIAA